MQIFIFFMLITGLFFAHNFAAADGCRDESYISAAGVVRIICAQNGKHIKTVNDQVVAVWNGVSWVYLDDHVISRDEFTADDLTINELGAGGAK